MRETLSFWEIIYEVFWQPDNLRNRIQPMQTGDKSIKLSIPHQSIQILRTIIVISFGIYFYAFGFRERIFRIPSRTSYNWISPYLDFVLIVLVAIILIMSWQWLDRLILKAFQLYSKENRPVIKIMQICSHVPLLIFTAIFTIIRVAYAKSYLLAGVDWLIWINISLVLGWHYLLWFYFLRSPILFSQAQQLRLIHAIIITIICACLGTVGFFIFGPPLLNATPLEFWFKVF